MLVIRLLGGLVLEADGQRLALPARRPAQALLGFLALNRGLHTRADVAALLWPDVLESSARSSLRSALSSVRRALGEHADAYLVTRREVIGLADGDEIAVDVDDFRALVARGHLDAAASTGRGTLLQGLEGEWIEQARREHADQLSDVLESLAAAAEGRGDVRGAVRHTREQVALEPLGEEANRRLIGRLAAAGDKASALDAYARLVERFRTQLHSTPSAQTRELAARVRVQVDEESRQAWAPLPLPPALEAHVPARMVGRKPELDALKATAAEVAAGSGGVVLVAGDAGIGKTALAARLASHAASEFTVLFGHCRRDEPAGFAPFLEALRHYAATAPVDRLLGELPPAAWQLAGAIPELAERSLSPAAGVPELPLAESGRFVRALIEALRGISGHRPLLLLVDDFQDADPGTLRAAAQLAPAIHSSKLMLVLAHREPADERVASTLRELRRLPHARSLTLGPLSRSEVAELARGVAGNAPAEDFVKALHRHTGGNPLFAEELVRRARTAEPGAAELERSALRDGPVPQRISDLILDELAALDQPTRRILASASVLGDEIELALLVRVTGTTVDRCLDALDEAVAAHVIRELPGGVGRFQFRHPLIRETLHEQLTATRRAHLHLRIADARESLGDPEDGSRVRAIAAHLMRARELASPSKLADYSVRGARAAEDALLHDEAALLYRSAANVAEPAGEERCRLLLALGRASRRAGQIGAAREAYSDAANAAGALRNHELLADAALGVSATPDFTRPQAVDELAVELLERALDSTPDSDPALRARILAQLASAQYFGGDHAQVRGLAEEAVSLARESADGSALGAALHVAHLIRKGSGDPVERLRIDDELLTLARAGKDPEQLALAHVRRAGDLFELGDFEGVRFERKALADLALDLRQPAYLWWAKLWEATEAIFLGSPDGERLSAQAFEAGRVAFGEAAELEFGAQGFWLRLEEGSLLQRGADIDARLARYSHLPAVQCAAARVAAEEGRLEQAAAALDHLTGPGLDGLMREAGWPLCAAVLAETCGRLGSVDAADRLRRAIDPAAGRWATSTFGSLCLGPLAGSLAIVCAVSGDGEGAARHRRQALDSCAAVGAMPAAERLERELGRLDASDGAKPGIRVSAGKR